MRFINHGYLQSINTHPTQGDGMHGEVCGRVPDPFSPPHRACMAYKREGKGQQRETRQIYK